MLIKQKEISPIVLQVGINISNIIKTKNLRQREVAHDAGLDVENLRKYLKGKQEMKITTMLKIVDALNVTVEDIFENTYKK